jgi:hypothetical protein
MARAMVQSPEKITLLTNDNINKYRRKGELLCHSQHCGKPLEVGDVIVTKPRSGKAVHWHVECFERLYYGG